MNQYKRLLSFLWLLTLILSTFVASSQDTMAGKSIDISQFRLSRTMARIVSSAYISHDADLNATYPSIQFSPGLIHRQWIPREYVTRKAVLRFNLLNSADSVVKTFFFPGVYYREINLYRVNGNQLEKLQTVLPDNPDRIGYRQISLAPRDSATFVAELVFIKTYLNSLYPRLVEPSYLNAFTVVMNNPHKESHLVTYVFCGLLLMMVLFSMASFVQRASREFLYYSGYAFLLGVMLFTKAAFTLHSSHLSFFLEEYLDFVMQSLGHMCYMIFMQKYLETKWQHPFLHKFYNTGILILTLAIAAFTFIHYFTENYPAQYAIENLTKVMLLLMTLIFLIYGIRHWRDKMLRYLFWGNLCLFVFSVASQTIIMFNTVARHLPGIFSSALFYYELGLFLELVFFLMALNHKNNRRLIAEARERERLKAENQMKEYEKELAVFKAQQQERERISADIHDELGSGMTAIRLMSEIAKNKMKDNIPAEIDKISVSADEVLNKMNAIIWSMDSGNDTLDNLVSYIRAYALEYFENTPMECIVNTPARIDTRELTGSKRRNLFLCVKETLNNALKHSRGTRITIHFDINSKLVIKISDNGVGFDPKMIRQFGNGLKNIARRMESIGGTYTIENGTGTVTTLTLPL